MNEIQRSAREGMTYIELMFVVVIIAMLASMAIPAWMKPREEAHRSICVQNLRIIKDSKTIWAIASGSGDGDTPTPEDLRRCIQQDVDKVRCPIDPDKSFLTSYSVGAIGSNPTCMIQGDTHILADDEDN